MTITVEQFKENKLKSERAQLLYRFIIALACFAAISLALGNLGLWQIPALVEVVLVFWFLGIPSVKSILGEIERPTRSAFNRRLTFSAVIILFIPFAVIMFNISNALLTNINFSEFKWESLLILTPGPVLLALVRQLPLKNDVESTHKIMLAASKKVFLSSVFFIVFFPVMLIVNTLDFNPATLTGSSSVVTWAIGALFFWIATFLFYSGLLLVLYAIGDIFSLLEERS